MTKKELAKIYYQNREVKYINIMFGDEHHSIYIGSSVHISGKSQIITMNYDQIEHNDDDTEKEFSISEWEVKDHLDKVQVNHISEGIMIEWLSSKQEVKSSLFIPMVRILHITVDNPDYDKDDELPKGSIDK